MAAAATTTNAAVRLLRLASHVVCFASLPLLERWSTAETKPLDGWLDAGTNSLDRWLTAVTGLVDGWLTAATDRQIANGAADTKAEDDEQSISIGEGTTDRFTERLDMIIGTICTAAGKPILLLLLRYGQWN